MNPFGKITIVNFELDKINKIWWSNKAKRYNIEENLLPFEFEKKKGLNEDFADNDLGKTFKKILTIYNSRVNSTKKGIN